MAAPFANFEMLEIDGAEILSFLIEPSAKVVIETSKSSSSSDFARICELQFNQALHVSVELEAKPWLKTITSHHIYDDSSYLMERLREMKREIQSEDIFKHYVIVIQDSGKVDVIARDFIFVLKKEIPRRRHGHS